MMKLSLFMALLVLWFGTTDSIESALSVDKEVQATVEQARASQRQQFQWVDLNEDEMKGWYTPTGACIDRFHADFILSTVPSLPLLTSS